MTSRWAISDFTLATALGAGRKPTLDAMRSARSGLAPRGFETAQLDTWLDGSAKELFSFHAPRCNRVVAAVFARIKK